MVLDTEDGKEWYYMQRREVGHRASHEEKESTERAKTLAGEEAALAIQDAINQDWLQGLGYGTSIGCGGGAPVQAAPAISRWVLSSVVSQM